MKKSFIYSKFGLLAGVALIALAASPAVAQNSPLPRPLPARTTTPRAGALPQKPIVQPTRTTSPARVAPDLNQRNTPRKSTHEVGDNRPNCYNGAGYYVPTYPGPDAPLPQPGTYYYPNPYYNNGYYNNGYYNNGYYNNGYYNNGYYNNGYTGPGTAFPPFQGY